MAADCLVPAGFQDIQFIKSHIINTLVTNNQPEYEACIHANPWAIYQLDMEDIRSNIERYQSETGYDERMCVAYTRITRTEHPDKTLENQLKSDQTKPPTLLQLTVYTIRQHVLETSEKTSLYPLLRKLDVPTVLFNILTLEAFVDYSLPPDKRVE